MKFIQKLGYIKNTNGVFDVCVVDHLGDLWLATRDPEDDSYDTLQIVEDVQDAIRIANTLFKTQDEYVVTASNNIRTTEGSYMGDEILLTPAALLDFLRQVDELADKDIAVDETGSTITVTIGESTYGIDLNQAEDIEVPDEVVEEVSDVADTAYTELGGAGVEFTEIEEDVVEGGLIKEALKTLAVGGLVRLTAKLLGK